MDFSFSLLHLFYMFIGILVTLFLFNIFSKKKTEGMNNNDQSSNGENGENGIGANSEQYMSTIKTQNIKMQDIFLLDKYKSQYTSIILSLDDYLNNMMLNCALTKFNNPDELINKLSTMQQAKNALNSIMKFVDQ